MKYRLILQVKPPSPFGLPDEGKTVIPAGIDLEGDVLDTRTLTRVGYGTLSHYRGVDEAIRVPFPLSDSVGAELRDNFLWITCEAPDARTALSTAIPLVDRFLEHLTLSTGRLFSADMIQLTTEDGAPQPLPRKVELMSLTTYDLVSLARTIETTADYVQMLDPLLDKALEYYNFALFLLEGPATQADRFSRIYAHAASAVFLSFWKATTTIIGDSSHDKDFNQRYQRLGFDREFFTSRIEPVRRLRNNYDVAHYRVDDLGLQQVTQDLALCRALAEQVMTAYRNHLAAGGAPLP